jgi:glycosyltransferase involved in cell wall biosynthesis
MPGDAPLVSFCVPTYNRAQFLGQTLESALAQTVADFEIVVVDDVSPDATPELMRRLGDPRIRYVRNQTNLGVPENLNRAFSLARGRYLVLLEDHDLISPTYLEAALSILDRHPGVGFVGTGIVIIDQDGKPVRQWMADLGEVTPGRELLRFLLTHTTCPFSVTTVIRRSSLAGIEPAFDARHWWFADQHLWLQMAARSDFGFVREPLLQMREREADHYLINRDRERQMFTVLDRIHRDDWRLLHPKGGFRSALDWSEYEARKLGEMLRYRASRQWSTDEWSDADREMLRSYLPSATRWLVSAIELVPRPVLSWLRDAYLARLARATRLPP